MFPPEEGVFSFPLFSTIMTKNNIDEDKLWNYLSDMDIVELLELWEKLGGIYDSSEWGVADYLVSNYYPENIVKFLTSDIIPKLVSADADERKEAQEKMEQMGVT